MPVGPCSNCRFSRVDAKLIWGLVGSASRPRNHVWEGASECGLVWSSVVSVEFWRRASYFVVWANRAEILSSRRFQRAAGDPFSLVSERASDLTRTPIRKQRCFGGRQPSLLCSPAWLLLRCALLHLLADLVEAERLCEDGRPAYGGDVGCVLDRQDAVGACRARMTWALSGAFPTGGRCSAAPQLVGKGARRRLAL